MLLQVNKTTTFKSSVQAYTNPEGFALPLASHLAVLHSLHRRKDIVCFRYGAFNTHADLLSFHENMTEVRLLGSTGITPLPRYYEPLRIPTVNDERVIDSPPTLSLRRNPFALGITSDLPGSSADLSTRALPNHPEQSHRFFRSFIPGGWQASPIPAGWPLSYNSVTRPKRVRITLGSRLRRLGFQALRPFSIKRTGLTPHVWLPSRDRPRLHIERAIYMSDTFQSDRSTRLGLAYLRTQREPNKTHKYCLLLLTKMHELFSYKAERLLPFSAYLCVSA